jgi:hypothetical protein
LPILMGIAADGDGEPELLAVAFDEPSPQGMDALSEVIPADAMTADQTPVTAAAHSVGLSDVEAGPQAWAVDALSGLHAAALVAPVAATVVRNRGGRQVGDAARIAPGNAAGQPHGHPVGSDGSRQAAPRPADGAPTFYGVEADGRNVAVVVDMSGSMSGEPLERLKAELRGVINGLAPDCQLFIVFFNQSPHVLPPLGGPMVGAEYSDMESAHLRQQYLKWVDGVRAGGGTEPGLAMALALQTRPDTVFLMTDGQFDPTLTWAAIKECNGDLAVRINTIGVGVASDSPILKQIAAQTGGRHQSVAP